MNPETILVEKVIFWLSLALVVYPYVIYPLVLFLTYSITQAWRDLRYLGSPRNRRTETPSLAALPFAAGLAAPLSPDWPCFCWCTVRSGGSLP